MAEATKQKPKKGKKQRKVGRNAAFCAYYRLTRRRERNKAARLRKHLRRFPSDLVAKAALGVCEVVI